MAEAMESQSQPASCSFVSSVGFSSSIASRIDIPDVIPATNATSERSFSALRRVKN